MATSKSALKAIKVSLGSGDFEKAANQAEELLHQDSKNYTAFISLGFAREKLAQYELAEKALSSASNLKPQDVQASKGLITLYEKQGSAKLDQYHEVAHQLAATYGAQEDRAQCQNVIDKYEMFARKHGSEAQYRHALELTLPSCDLYSTLEGRVPHPAHTYKRILESSEKEERQWVNAQIGERRTRLGAKIDQVTQQVKSEAIGRFATEDQYRSLIDWTQDDEARADLENQLMQRMFDNLVVIPHDAKPEQRDRVLNYANGLVIIKRQLPLAWKVAFEWVDAEDLVAWDPNLFREYIGYFPDDGLSKVLRGFLDSNSSPFPQPPAGDKDDEEEVIKLSEAEQLILMQEGLEDCPDSALAHRMLAYTYLALEEYADAVGVSRKSQQLYNDISKRYAVNLQNSLDGVNLILGNALIPYLSPRYHPEARSLFHEILQRKPTLTAALLGVGLILEEDEDYVEAVKFLQQALERDQANLRIKLELAWCRALSDDIQAGLNDLEDIFSTVTSEKTPNLVMKSEVLYRIAYCKWHIDTSAAARRNKSGPYQYLIDSIKANSAYAPAYTLLGIYFQDYGKSKQRARVALQKAFELSTSELNAAERLARLFADSREWDLVELVAQRVVSSGKARPAPGSKKKAFSWPYAALGVVQMNKQQYSQSIVSFQSALRVTPDDYHSWVGLGESYHNAGRFVAASRAFIKAESINHGLPPNQTWFAKYMLANVQREMGSFDEAITAYEDVLKTQPDEYGVLISLLQTIAESAWAKISLGMFGAAAKLAARAIETAEKIVQSRTDVFNLWKAVGDACSVLGHAKAYSNEVDLGHLQSLLETSSSSDMFTPLSDVDKVELASFANTESSNDSYTSDLCLKSAILAHKRAVHATSGDVYAGAMSWYNLGWAEHQAYVSTSRSLKGKQPQRYLKAAMRCFKRAIELEAGNSDFWNALGVVTMTLSPKVSQHSFVRSLHLNDNSARTWTNIGALYLISNDIELANESFTKGQSADPEYADAWIGQGLIAMLSGNAKEARGLFVHAFEIADSSSLPAKHYYAVSAFDHLMKDVNRSEDITNLLQPLLALRQLRAQKPSEIVGSHLRALFAERTGEFGESADALQAVCDAVEVEYEKSESNDYLARFAQAKADLARARLGEGDFEAAIENAETALDLSSEDDLGPAYAQTRKQLRLSSHITAGLAHSHLKATDKAIKMFEAGRQESDNAPDIVCMLSQVLWATGGQEEQDAARSQLFDCVENNPEHVQSVMLLAVIGLLDEDQDVIDAVRDDLKALRTNDKVSVADKIKISKVLAGIVSCKDTDQDAGSLAAVADALNGIMLEPAQPQGWLELAQVADDQYAAQMALQNASKQVPPGGTLRAENLAQAYANTGRSEDVKQAIMLAPWKAAEYPIVTQSM